MKKLFLTFVFAIVATLTAMAQQISVVSTTGTTTIYRTLQEAIEGADPGSVIYLPGGGFTISDEVKINKKLTIIGIGHKSNNDNVDGVTTINGNLFFNEGSSSSAVLGCYITGNVNIGDGGAAVSDVLIKYCNLNAVFVNSILCLGTIVNQNYIRGDSDFGNSNPQIKNNILRFVRNIDGGIISNNIFTSSIASVNYAQWGEYSISPSNSSYINNNIFFPYNTYYPYYMVFGSNNQIAENMVKDNFGDGSIDWNNVFVNYNGGAISPSSDFHFKEDYKQYENQVGIYAGDGFNDNQMAPVPYIVAKDVKEQTDASGKLNVKIRVKAGQ